MKEKFSRWDVADYLSTEEDIAEYLNACIEEDPGDGSLIRAALGDIARAKGMMDLAKKTGLTREGLYKALSPRGNPSFSTILKVSRALGVDLHFDIRNQNQWGHKINGVRVKHSDSITSHDRGSSGH